MYVLYEHVFPNGKKYIGITNDAKRRFSNGGKGYSNNKQMREAIDKYGWDNVKHNIIESDLTRTEAAIKEREYIEKEDTIRNGYNISPGGTVGSTLYCKHITQMLKTASKDERFKPFCKKAYDLSEDESWAYQMNLVDIIIREDVDWYKNARFNDLYDEFNAWFYLMSYWIMNNDNVINAKPLKRGVYGQWESQS